MIPECFASYSELLGLDLQMNNFYGSIPQTFSMCNRLMSLDFYGNQLEGPLPPSLANCISLEVLNVGNNRIEDSFPHWLASLPALQMLILRSNRFHGLIDDPQTRFSFPKLRILDISHNLFTGLLPTTYIINFEAMKRGTNDHNELVYMGDGIYQDSVILAAKGINIRYEKIPDILTAISLSNNRFQGQILAVVGMLNRIELLNFSYNHLNGQIPCSLRNLTQDESLDLSSNKLVGEIPSQLEKLYFLEVLNLSYNRLVGPIPQENQFRTFTNMSYIGNLGLGGFPMSNNCSNDEHNISGWLDWKVIMMGYGTGLVIGLSMGYIVFSTGKPWWFLSKVERKVLKLARRHKRGGRRD